MRKLIPALLVAAIVVAGCGGDDDNDSADPGTSDTTVAGGSGTTTGDSSDDDFNQLLEDAKKTRIRVTYESSSSDGGTEQLGTISQDGTGKQAYFAPDGDSQTIIDGENVIACTNLKTTPECSQFSGEGAALYTAPLSFLTIPATAITAAGDSAFTDESTETIAGREARCVGIDYLSVEWKACADKETGVLLKWEAGAGGQSGAFVATEVGEPKDSDFEPPAEPSEVTVPSIPDISLPEGVTLPGG
jgi:hypothetical protein